MIEFSPLPWGEGGESSEPGEGFLPTEPRLPPAECPGLSPTTRNTQEIVLRTP